MSIPTQTEPKTTTQASQVKTLTYPQNPQEKLRQHFQLLGSISFLMLHSPLHRRYQVERLESQVLPSLIHNQFR